MMQKNSSRKSAKKGQIWVSAIIYTMVAILALVLILNTGIPLLTELREKAVFEKVKDIMLDLDRHITEIANQGEGSQAAVSFEIRDGQMKFEDNQIVWEIETKSEIISPRSSTKLGNLVIASNANVKTYDAGNYYIMETGIKNDTFRVTINKIGQNSWEQFHTLEIIENVSYNNNNMDGNFTFSLNSNPESANGTGYTVMYPSGNNTNLGKAKVVAHMNSTFAEYDLVFTLESYADFLRVNVKNIKIK